MESTPSSGLVGEMDTDGVVIRFNKVSDVCPLSVPPLLSVTLAMQVMVSVGIPAVVAKSKETPVPTTLPATCQINEGVRVSSGSTTLAMHSTTLSLYKPAVAWILTLEMVGTVFKIVVEALDVSDSPSESVAVNDAFDSISNITLI